MSDIFGSENGLGAGIYREVLKYLAENKTPVSANDVSYGDATVQRQLDMLYFGVANVWDKRFGVDATGVVESSAQIQAAMDSEKFVNFGSGVYKIGAMLLPKTGKHLLFSSAEIKTAVSNPLLPNSVSAFYCDQISDFSFSGQLSINGTVVGAPIFEGEGGGGHGIIVRACHSWSIENVAVKWFSGCGIFITTTGDPWYQVGPGVSLGQVSNCRTQQCGYGVKMSGGFMAEYVTFTNCFSQYNANAGFQGYAGNVMWTGGAISHNYLNGIELRSDFNSAHGGFSGVMINHNKQANVVAIGVTNAHAFTGCTIFDDNAGPRMGAIFLTESTGITFTGCILAADFVVANAAKDKINLVANCVFGSGGDAGRQYQVYSDDGSESTVVFSGCYQAGGMGDGVPNGGLSVSDAQMRAGVDQNMVAAAMTRVTWNALVNRHGFALHEDSMRNFKVKAPGIYRINCYLDMASANATMPASGMYAELRVNDVPVRRATIQGSNASAAYANLPFTVNLAANDVVDLYVYNPSGTVAINAGSEISISAG